MKKNIAITNALLAILVLAGCQGQDVSSSVTSSSEASFNYSGDLVLNTFSDVADLYRVTQQYYMAGNKYAGYGPLGKLDIVKDATGNPDNKVLKVYYEQSVEAQGGFTNIISRFSRYSALEKADLTKLGGMDVRLYNANEEDVTATLSLIDKDLNEVTFDKSVITLPKGTWTKAHLDFSPIILQGMTGEIEGLSVEFSKRTDKATYYMDDLGISWTQVMSESDKKYSDEVKAIISGIDSVTSGEITLEKEPTLSDLYIRYQALPAGYQSIVNNYNKLQNAIATYRKVRVNEEQAALKPVTILPFDKGLGLASVANFGTTAFSYQKEIHSPKEEGAMKVNFVGDPGWATVTLSPEAANYDEIHFWVKNELKNANDGSQARLAFMLDWKTISATGGAAYDENGKEVGEDTLIRSFNFLEKDGWVEIVMTMSASIREFNILPTGPDHGNPIATEGHFYIGAVTGYNRSASEVGTAIDALEEKDSYTEEELVAIDKLYARYAALSEESKALIGETRCQKIERIYKAQKPNMVKAVLSRLDAQEALTPDELKTVKDFKAQYDAMSEEDKAKYDAKTVSSLVAKLGYVEAETNPYLNGQAYDSMEHLRYNFAHAAGERKFSLEYYAEGNSSSSGELHFKTPVAKSEKAVISVMYNSASNECAWLLDSTSTGSVWINPDGMGAPLANKDAGFRTFTYTFGRTTEPIVLPIVGFVFADATWSGMPISILLGDVSF